MVNLHNIIFHKFIWINKYIVVQNFKKQSKVFQISQYPVIAWSVPLSFIVLHAIQSLIVLIISIYAETTSD